MKKKVLALVLTLAMLASVLTVPAAAAGGKTFPDAKGHWAEESIMRWNRSGLVNGDDLGNVNPNKPLRRCEMATILSNMLGLRTAAPISTFLDIDGTEWYARAILRCAAAGIMQGSNSMSYPEDYITREEAITMFCRALNVQRDEDPDLSKFSDGNKVSGWAAPYMGTLTELGILSGMGDGTVAPHDYINRAGAFVLMDKAISVYANAPGNYTSQNPNGFVVINSNDYQSGDVTLSGKAVGVLVSVNTTDTVRLRDLSAENVVINGKGSVIISGKSSLDNVEAHTEIELTVEADATVDTLDMNGERIALTNAGTVKNLNCDKVATVTNSGKVENLVADAAVSITNTGTVDKLVANAGIKVDNNKGTIKNAEINMGGVVMDGAPQQMTVASGVARPNNSGGRPISATGAVSTGSGDKRPSNTGSTTAVESVVLSLNSWALKVGESVELEAYVEPKNATNQTLTWKSDDTTVATVDKNGKVTAEGVGRATITVSSNNNKTDTCKIVVYPADTKIIPLDSVEFDAGEEGIIVENGKQAGLYLIKTPLNATVVSIEYESSAPNIATVTKDDEVDNWAEVTGVTPGKAIIKATVTVPVAEEGEDSSSSSSGTGSGGGSSMPTPSKPSSGNVPDDDSTNVTTQAEGDTEGSETPETLKTKTFEVTCKVEVKAKTVTPVPATSVTISGKPESVKVNDTFELTAKVEPEDTTDTTVTWEVTEGKDVVEITEGHGTKTIKVKALKEGPATIKATAGEVSNSINLTVDPKGDDNPPTQEHEVALSQTSLILTLKDGETVTETLVVKVDSEPTTATAEWSGGNESIATVDGNGVVTAVGVGTTSITAKVTINEKEYELTCAVEVKPAAQVVDPSKPTITAVNLDKTGTIQMTVDSTENGEVTIKATITMSDGLDATETVDWSVTGDVDAVEYNINENEITVKAKSEGTVTITATAGTKSANCTVTVEEASAPPVNLTIDKVEFNAFDQSTITKDVPFDLAQYLTVVVNPEGTNYTTDWEVVPKEGEEAIATVSPSGEVTFTAAGKVTVKVTVTITVEGSNPITETKTIELTLASNSDENQSTTGDDE